MGLLSIDEVINDSCWSYIKVTPGADIDLLLNKYRDNDKYNIVNLCDVTNVCDIDFSKIVVLYTEQVFRKTHSPVPQLNIKGYEKPGLFDCIHAICKEVRGEKFIVIEKCVEESKNTLQLPELNVTYTSALPSTLLFTSDCHIWFEESNAILVKHKVHGINVLTGVY